MIPKTLGPADVIGGHLQFLDGVTRTDFSQSGNGQFDFGILLGMDSPLATPDVGLVDSDAVQAPIFKRFRSRTRRC